MADPAHRAGFPSPETAGFGRALRAAGFSGEIADDPATRLVFATDNSIYQVPPALVLFPASADDLRLVARTGAETRFRDIAFTARGGGTGTNGQSLNTTVVVDTSRHLDRIIEIDPVGRRARVQPGVVLDQLNTALAPEGLFFAPHVSTASRATLGGMIGTDACGKGSARYGRTHDHVESLRLLLGDGRELLLRSLSPAEVDAADTPEAALARDLRALCQARRDAIRQGFPEMVRSLTGYNLRDAFPDDGSVHLQHLAAGAEGTLGLITEATLRLTPRPSLRGMAVVRYQRFDDALQDARALLATRPAAIETLDEHLFDLARTDADWFRVADAMTGGQEPDGPLVVNFVEYEDDDEDGLAAQFDALAQALTASGRCLGHHVTRDANEQSALWGIRGRSVGMLGRRPGPRKPVPFIEDTVVPPERLPEYIAALRALLERQGVEYAMFGHVDVGCLHVRPALDMTDPADAAMVRRITDEVVALLQRHGGILWGEHGKGFRGEYAPTFFGEALYPLLAAVKRAFDPDNRMNPGKIVTPDGDPAKVAGIDSVSLRGSHDRQVTDPVRRRWQPAVDCNGNGVCFDWDARQPICPSYKITRDRIHSPKGRAALLREWLRQLAREGRSPEDSARLSPRRRRRDDPEDFAHQVYDALQGCLGCKACATQCPVHVNIPEMRGRFLASYHRRYRRPLRDYAVGGLEHLTPAASALAPAVNAALESSPGRRLTGWLGLADLPRFARTNAHRRLRDNGVPVIDAEAVSDLSPGERDQSVFVLADTFTTYLDPAVPPALAEVIRAAGQTPVFIASRPSGKALQVHGFMDAFRGAALAQTKRLARLTSLGRPVLGIDPSITLAYRDEVRRAVGGRDWSPPLLPQEWLTRAALPNARSADDVTYRLFLHCTETTAQPRAARQWRDIFRRAGLTLEVEAAGCCGMAGTYGHLAEHQDHSRGLYDLAWREGVEETGPEQVLATGYSCRSQVTRFSGFRPAHPLEVLARHLGS